jgi:6-phosphogluconolactonase
MREAIQQSGCCAVALSGGSTPQEVYRQLASQERASALEWSQIHLFWGDERCVPPDDADSNFGMAKRVLIDLIPIPAANVHRIQGEHPAEYAARVYDMEVREFFGAGPSPSARPVDERPGRFDLVLLGLGEDGHTASLFPGSAALEERERWAVPTQVPGSGAWRVTLTLPVINSASEIVFLVSGGSKARILRDALEGKGPGTGLPARMVRPDHGRLRWLVDADAASLLEVRGPGRPS